MNIRLLKADEIDVRVQSTKKTNKGVGCIVLLYKDARCDMKILDETFGVLGWEREHSLINGNLFCTVRVWDKENSRWVSKQDVGTESNTEKEKGQASDSFKRACFNLGIGRELYTAPFTWIDLKEGEWYESNAKVTVSAFVKFSVKSISYNDQREISSLEIVDSKGVVRYSLKGSNKPVELQEVPSNTNTLPQQNKANTSQSKANDDILVCADCKTKINQAVHDFSVKQFGRQLCRKCQDVVKKAVK